ncbi:oxygenase MpaB family protein [Novosphingobium sp. M1R2S20]|uniref:Oxygenase MpaB family protein n=1 Tax=Novosphingobium rhizovicinum TaxID=3228928 RepID=A0ABV3R8F3_9SPHN
MQGTRFLPGRLKAAISHQVVSLFNDVDRGEKPVIRSDHALFPRGSVIWRVHGDVGTMMVGGIASLLMQMLHPSVLAGVWDHSNFRADMHGRLRRTARFIAKTTYAERDEAEAAITTVRRVHEHVSGQLPEGKPYHANDPHLLAWVHVTEASSFLDAWIRYSEPLMSRADQDRYFAQIALIGEALGAAPVPRTRAEAQRIIAATKPELRVDARTREVADLILKGRVTSGLTEMPRKLAMQAAVDLLPPWARAMHGRRLSPLERPFVRVGTFGVAQTLRWAFR